MTFSFYSGGGYAHAIKTRHNGTAQGGNSLDFYPWQPSDGVNNAANTCMMSVTGPGVGINNANPSYALDVNGAVRTGSYIRASYAINVSTTVNNATQVCYITDGSTGSTYQINISVVNSRPYNPVMKTYRIPVGFNFQQAITGLGWLRCLTESNSGPNNGNDFAVDIISSGNPAVTYVRVVRTASGTNPTTGMTFNIEVISDAGIPVTLTYDGSAQTNTVNSGLYNVNPLCTSMGNVGVNISTPTYLTHVQPQNTDVPAINPDATNTLLVYEDCRGSTISSGALSGVAALNSGGYITLTSNGVNTSGFLNYIINPGTAFDVTLDHFQTGYNGGGDATFFYVYSSTANSTYSGASNGYTVVFDEYSSNPFTVALYWNNTLLASQTTSTFTQPANTWTQVRMTFVRNVWRVWYGTQQVINYQDVSRTLVGPATMNMGFGASSGAATNFHSIRSIVIAKHTIGHWRAAAGGNVAGISYNGPVTVNGGPLTTTGNVYSTGGYTVSTQNPGDLLMVNYSGNDRYGVQQVSLGRMRMVTSPAYGAASAGFATASSDSNGTNMQDILVCGNTYINLLRQTTVSGPLIQNTAVYGQYNMSSITVNNTSYNNWPVTLGSGTIVTNSSGQPVAPYTGFYTFHINFWANAQTVVELIVIANGSQTNRVINQYAAANTLNLTRFVMGGSLYMVAGDYFTWSIATNGNNTINQGNGPAFALFLVQRLA